MTLQQLEYFLAALNHRSFSGAAEALSLAQPSLSEQVRRLEAELGVSLFTRVGRGIAPTAAADALRPHAEAVIAAIRQAREAVVEQRDLSGGVASFGTHGDARHYPGADLVAAFRRRHPNVRVRLIGQNSVAVAAAVRAGELEAGLVALPIDDRGLDVRPIMRDELVYLSADPLNLAEPITIERLAVAPLIVSDASYAKVDSTRVQLSAAAQRAGVSIRPIVEVEDVEVAVDLVIRAIGDTIVSRRVLFSLFSQIPEHVGWRPLAEPFEEMFAFIKRRDARLSPASHAFMDLAERRMREIAAWIEEMPASRDVGADA